MRASITGAFAALSLAGAANAQTPPPAAALDPQRLALAQQIYDMMNGQTLTATTQAIRAMMTRVVGQAGGPDAAREKAAQAAISDSVDRMIPKVLHGTVKIMAQDFTAPQLRDMLAFYRSPTGQAVLAKMPEITRQSMQLSLDYLPDMMRDFETDYCGRVSCTAQERAAFTQMQARMVHSSTPAAVSP